MPNFCERVFAIVCFKSVTNSSLLNTWHGLDGDWTEELYILISYLDAVDHSATCCSFPTAPYVLTSWRTTTNLFCEKSLSLLQKDLVGCFRKAYLRDDELCLAAKFFQLVFDVHLGFTSTSGRLGGQCPLTPKHHQYPNPCQQHLEYQSILPWSPLNLSKELLLNFYGNSCFQPCTTTGFSAHLLTVHTDFHD